MREAQFLKQNTDKWKQFEAEVNQSNNPDLFADRFVELTDDLAYAKTFYPEAVLPNTLTDWRCAFTRKYIPIKKKNQTGSGISGNLSCLICSGSTIGPCYILFYFLQPLLLLVCYRPKYDESFLRLILGDGYVNMTNENIEKGDPFGVYKRQEPVSMFLGIAFNNIRVSFLAFVFVHFFHWNRFAADAQRVDDGCV